IGRQPIIQTIMAGKMEMVLPAIYIMNRFMGICFSGASATSQQRCRGRESTDIRDAGRTALLGPWASNTSRQDSLLCLLLSTALSLFFIISCIL
uniref:Uncharacterized protein n=1 Tax=Amazona collaria TaxID=241587 RepID=A0A8B9GBB2_9PSIT